MKDSLDILKPREDDYIEHHGVKGMKWGVRKSDDTKPPLKVPVEIEIGLLQERRKLPREMVLVLIKEAKECI